MLEKMQVLYNRCKDCSKCALCKTRTNVVFGVGDERSDIMFIGEGPGENEDITGEPFVGRSGQMLDDMLAAVGLERRNVYIANIVKCRPPKNRDPMPQEKQMCIHWLFEQIEIVNPKIVVCLGRISSASIIDDDIKITIQHGKFIEKNGRLYMPMLHPAAILRNPKLKIEALNDFCYLKTKLKSL